MRHKFLFSVFCLSLMGGGSAEAKDLSSRLGIGYTNQFSLDIPGIAVQYYPNKKLGLSTILGIDTKKNASKFGLMVKMYRIIFTEDQMNFYTGAGGSLISREAPKPGASSVMENRNGFELNAYVGGEFFLPGLSSLGFSFEAGVGIISTANQVRFKTFGDHPLKAGIIFYL